MNSIYSSGVVAATPRRWSTVAMSFVLHVALVLVLAFAGQAAGVLPETPTRSLTFVSLVLPLPPPPVTRPAVRLPPVVKEAVKREPEIKIPEIVKPPAPERVVARVEPPRPAPEESPVAVDRPKPAPPVVRVGAFESATSAQAVQPSLAVQQAGFDTADARVAGPQIASAVVGGFEQAAPGWQPPGRGRPNGVADAGFGTGMAAGPAGRGQPKGVADAGFGTGIAAGPAGGGRGGRVVAAAGLDAGTGGGGGGARAPQAVKGTDFDARAAQPSAPKVSREARTEVPVEILSKPTPEYTDEARALKIEGEVALEVEFAATGEIRVLKVVRSLGHGLDERAARAVQGMRFKPAQRHGQPVDVRTTVNIVFRLA